MLWTSSQWNIGPSRDQDSKRYSSFIEWRLTIDVAVILFIEGIHDKKMYHQLNRPFYGVIKSNVMIENIFKQTKYANKIIYIKDI